MLFDKQKIVNKYVVYCVLLFKIKFINLQTVLGR